MRTSAGKEPYNHRVIEDAILNRLVERLHDVLAPPALPLRPWVVDGHVAGYLDDARADMLARFDGVFEVAEAAVRFAPSIDSPEPRTAALETVTRSLATEHALTAWRDERYAVARTPADPPLFLIERAAARFFGIATEAAHVNGITVRDGRTRMWIARRSVCKPIDPGLLDSLVGGGVAAGTSVTGTVVKEAWEEAGIPNGLASRAAHAGGVRILRLQRDGLQRETLHVFDLELPPGFQPVNQDGEVAGFHLVSIEALAELMGNAEGPDVMTADAALVAADWLLRKPGLRWPVGTRERLERLCRGNAA